jgi:uncharacterized protein YjdB
MVAALRRTAALGFLALLLTACSDDPAGPASVESVEVTSPVASIVAGQTVQLSIVIKDQSGNALPDRAITWSSDNQTVATVSATGVVTALAPGSATITASAEDKVGRVTLTIAPVPIATLTLSPNPAEVRVGLTTQLTLIARDAAGNELGGRPAILVTSNASVAAIDANRMVAGMSAGTATITATSEGKTATATVNVVPGPVTSVEITPQTANIQGSGTVYQFTAIARDASGAAVSGRAFTWMSADPLVAPVNSMGLVTGRNPGGPVTITATVEGKSATARITVLPEPIATLTISPNPVEVRAGFTTQLTVVARDAAGNVLGPRPVTLSTSNPAVATVDGLVLIGVSQGTATITATAEGKTATTTVNVGPGPIATVTVTPQNPQVREGATIRLFATTRDASGALVTARSVAWASSNTGVATLDGTGLVTGAAAGTTTITATSEGKSGSTTVTVLRAQVTSVRFAPFPDPFIVGDTVRARATAVDSLGRELPDRTVTYSGSNDAVATVSPSGLMGGVNAGSVTITATSEGVSATQTGSVVDVYPSFDALTCQAVKVGATCTASARIRYTANGNGFPGARTIEFTSSDPAVARVAQPSTSQGTSQTATITGVSAGSVTLTATYVGANGVTRSRTMPFRVDP